MDSARPNAGYHQVELSVRMSKVLRYNLGSRVPHYEGNYTKLAALAQTLDCTAESLMQVVERSIDKRGRPRFETKMHDMDVLIRARKGVVLADAQGAASQRLLPTSPPQSTTPLVASSPNLVSSCGAAHTIKEIQDLKRQLVHIEAMVQDLRSNVAHLILMDEEILRQLKHNDHRVLAEHPRPMQAPGDPLALAHVDGISAAGSTTQPPAPPPPPPPPTEKPQHESDGADVPCPPSAKPPKWVPVTLNGKAVADFDPEPFGAEYIALEKNCDVRVLPPPDGQSYEGWSYGDAGCLRGWFPTNFVATPA